MGEKDFAYFLVGGLAIMGILLVAFSLSFPTSDYASSYSGFGSPIFVGRSNFENVDTIIASFEADNLRQSKLYDLSSRQTTNGLLFGSNSIKLDVGNAQEVQLSFDVVKTNGYGPLIIKINDQVVFQSRLDEGNYDFRFASGGKVEIIAGSSEWRIWAPTVYELRDLRVGADVYPREISTYTFELTEPEKIGQARIDFNLRENAGAIVLKLNGDVVYEGALNPQQSIYIDSNRLNRINILTFDAIEDSKFTGRATIALTTIREHDKELKADINLTQSEYAKMREGLLAFNVVDVFSNGGYTISIVNNNATLLNEYVKLEKGYFEFTLKKENLKPGLNTVIIRSIDGAAFNVQGMLTRF